MTRCGLIIVGMMKQKLAIIPSHTTRPNQIAYLFVTGSNFMSVSSQQSKSRESLASLVSQEPQTCLLTLDSLDSLDSRLFLEFLHVFDQRVLFIRRQIRAVSMSGVAVAGRTGIQQEKLVAVLFRDIRDKAEFDLIEDIVAAIESLRPALRRFEQVSERRHRAVVQERRAQPDAVERHVGVAVRLAKMREAPGVS